MTEQEIEQETVQERLQMVGIAEMAKIFSVSPNTIRNWKSDPSFPQPYRIDRRTHRWSLREVETFIANLPRN